MTGSVGRIPADILLRIEGQWGLTRCIGLNALFGRIGPLLCNGTSIRPSPDKQHCRQGSRYMILDFLGFTPLSLVILRSPHSSLWCEKHQVKSMAIMSGRAKGKIIGKPF